jgi:gliding motility-associated protein GldL
MSQKKSVFETKKFKNFMKFVYGFGGAIVIVGAMFKITHWPGATEMLVAGLSTEALIFILSAFEPLHEEVDWSIVYPELSEEGAVSKNRKPSQNKGLTQELDNMLGSAGIDAKLIQSLGEGMKAISQQADTLKEVGNVGLASKAFAERLNQATDKVGQIAESSDKISATFSELAKSKTDAKRFSDAVSHVSDNLEALAGTYQKQLKVVSKNVENSAISTEEFKVLVDNLKHSLKQSNAYKNNLDDLVHNLDALNGMYEKMLQDLKTGNEEKQRSIFSTLFGFSKKNKK